MKAYILRRRKLGRTSCREIKVLSKSNIEIVRSDADPFPQDVDVLFRWGTTNNFPKIDGQLVVNSAESIHWCADKKKGRMAMQEVGVPVPESWDAKNFMTLNPDHYPDYKFVLRRARHAQGKDLWAGSFKETVDSIRFHNVYDGYVSRLIDKVAEYRVYVIQGRVACVAKKTPGNPEAVAWNVARGGRFDNVRWGDWPMAAVAAAIAAAELSGTDFCGVDVMVDAEGRPYVLEVNSAPSLTSPYRQTCFARAFDFIVNNKSVEKIPVNAWRGWKDVIHPAVAENG